MPSTKRRPSLPPFYLRYFSNSKEQLRAYRTANRQPPYMTALKKAVDDAGSYMLDLPDGVNAMSLDGELSRIESEARKAIDGMLAGKFPPSGSERRSLARYMLTHIMAAPWSEAAHANVFVSLLRDALAKIDRDDAARHLTELGLEADDAALDAYMAAHAEADPESLLNNPEQDVVLRLHVADHAATILMQRYWLLGTSASGAICTGDRPVVAYESPDLSHDHDDNEADNHHPEERQQIYFPLGRRHVLALSLAGSFVEQETPLGDSDVAFVNNLIATASNAFVFQHPDAKPAKLVRRH